LPCKFCQQIFYCTLAIGKMHCTYIFSNHFICLLYQTFWLTSTDMHYLFAFPCLPSQCWKCSITSFFLGKILSNALWGILFANLEPLLWLCFTIFFNVKYMLSCHMASSVSREFATNVVSWNFPDLLTGPQFAPCWSDLIILQPMWNL
jgi:hypothetical protein